MTCSAFLLFIFSLRSMPFLLSYMPCSELALCKELCSTQSGTQAGKCGGADGTLGEYQYTCQSAFPSTKHSFAPFFPHMDPIQVLLKGESQKAHSLGILIKVRYL